MRLSAQAGRCLESQGSWRVEWYITQSRLTCQPSTQNSTSSTTIINTYCQTIHI